MGKLRFFDVAYDAVRAKERTLEAQSEMERAVNEFQDAVLVDDNRKREVNAFLEKSGVKEGAKIIFEMDGNHWLFTKTYDGVLIHKTISQYAIPYVTVDEPEACDEDSGAVKAEAS